MKASSSEASLGVSSCRTIPAAAAISPTRGDSIPVTLRPAAGAPLFSCFTTPPSAVISSLSLSAWGERTSTERSELRAMNSSVGQSAISLPLPMTMRWSAVTAISFIRWLDTKMVRPSAASCFIRFLTHRIPSGSSPLTGSSRSSTGGSPSMAAAMPTRWLMPSEYPPVRLCATGVSPTSASTSSTRRRDRPWLWARKSRWL